MVDEIEPSAATFIRVLKTEAVSEDNRIDVYLGAADRAGYRFGFAASIVPALMLELRGRMEQLRPDDPDKTLTTAMKPVGVKIAVGTRSTALIVSMEGYDLALELTPETVHSLHEGLGQLLALN